MRFLSVLLIIGLLPTILLSQETITVTVDPEYSSEGDNVIFSITPSVNRACIYNFYAQQRKRRLKKVPQGAVSIATFQWEGPVAIQAFSLEPLKKPSKKQARRFRRNVYFKMMIRCDGYEGERFYSPIYKLKLLTAKESSIKSVKAWIQEAKFHMQYVN